MSIDYELICRKADWNTPANEFVRLYHLVRDSDLFGQLISITIEYKAYSWHENGQLKYGLVKKWRYDDEQADSINNTIATISNQFATDEYRIQGVWSVNRLYKNDGEEVQHRFTCKFVGGQFDFQPETKKDHFRMSLEVDNSKLYSPQIKRKWAIYNMSKLLDELDVLMALGFDCIIGLNPDRELEVESSNLIFVPEFSMLEQLLDIEISENFIVELSELVEMTDNIYLRYMTNGFVIYCLGTHTSLGIFIDKLKMRFKR